MVMSKLKSSCILTLVAVGGVGDLVRDRISVRGGDASLARWTLFVRTWVVDTRASIHNIPTQFIIYA
jgi:hypothetical protein